MNNPVHRYTLGALLIATAAGCTGTIGALKNAPDEAEGASASAGGRGGQQGSHGSGTAVDGGGTTSVTADGGINAGASSNTGGAKQSGNTGGAAGKGGATQSGPISVGVSPTAVSVQSGGSVQLKATVTGGDQSITWQVKEGAMGGGVTPNGFYTAPLKAGTYHVVVTSTADPSKSATVIVTVSAFVPPVCAASGGATGTPPALTPGVWKDISPASLGGGTQNYNLQGMAIDPCNPSTLYIGVCGLVPGSNTLLPNTGVYRSTDAGSSWTKIGVPDTPVNIRVDPKDPLHLYVGDGVWGGTMGFWVSKDGGATWAMPNGFKQAATKINDFDVYHVEPDPADFNHVLVTFHSPWHNPCSGSCNGGIFESFDGGDNWTLHEPRPEWAGHYGYDVFFLYNPTLGIGNSSTWLFATQGGGGMWRTTDSGATWTKVTDTSMTHGGDNLFYAKNGVAYLGAELYPLRSTDNGATWQQVKNGVPYSYYLAIIGDGTNLYTSSYSGPVITSPETDGLNWKPIGTHSFKSPAFQMALDPVQNIVYASFGGGGGSWDGIWALKAP